MWPRTDDIVLALLAPFLGLLLARQQWQLAALAAMIGLILLVSRLLASRRADDRRPAGDEDPPHLPDELAHMSFDLLFTRQDRPDETGEHELPEVLDEFRDLVIARRYDLAGTADTRMGPD